MLLSAWDRYWTDANRAFDRVYGEYSKGINANWDELKTQFAAAKIHEEVRTNLRELHTAMKKCREVCERSPDSEGLLLVSSLLGAVAVMLGGGEEWLGPPSWRTIAVHLGDGTCGTPISATAERGDVSNINGNNGASMPVDLKASPALGNSTASEVPSNHSVASDHIATVRQSCIADVISKAVAKAMATEQIAPPKKVEGKSDAKAEGKTDATEQGNHESEQLPQRKMSTEDKIGFLRRASENGTARRNSQRLSRLSRGSISKHGGDDHHGGSSSASDSGGGSATTEETRNHAAVLTLATPATSPGAAPTESPATVVKVGATEPDRTEVSIAELPTVDGVLIPNTGPGGNASSGVQTSSSNAISTSSLLMPGLALKQVPGKSPDVPQLPVDKRVQATRPPLLNGQARFSPTPRTTTSPVVITRQYRSSAVSDRGSLGRAVGYGGAVIRSTSWTPRHATRVCRQSSAGSDRLSQSSSAQHESTEKAAHQNYYVHQPRDALQPAAGSSTSAPQPTGTSASQVGRSESREPSVTQRVTQGVAPPSPISARRSASANFLNSSVANPFVSPVPSVALGSVPPLCNFSSEIGTPGLQLPWLPRSEPMRGSMGSSSSKNSLTLGLPGFPKMQFSFSPPMAQPLV